jgi:hypothetical protein
MEGGIAIEAGSDRNRNGALDNSEVDSAATRILCNGRAGLMGLQGTSGAPAKRGTIVSLDTTSIRGIGTVSVTGRRLQFTRTSTMSVLWVTYSDSFSVNIENDSGCVWEVLFDGRSCVDPSPLTLKFGSDLDMGSIVLGFTFPFSISGYCKATTAGPFSAGSSVMLSVFGAATNQTPNARCDVGLGGAGVLAAEELILIQ